MDLKTDITGLTLKDLKEVTMTLEDVQKALRKIVGPDVILVGHGLVHDLKVGQLCKLRIHESSWTNSARPDFLSIPAILLRIAVITCT